MPNDPDWLRLRNGVANESSRLFYIMLLLGHVDEGVSERPLRLLS